MRALTWNIRHGGTSRVEAILAAVQAHAPDLVVLTEFRNNTAGQRLREALASLGLRHQSRAHDQVTVNTVWVAARKAFVEQTFDILGIDVHRCVLARMGDVNVFGLYFPNLKKKEPLFRFLVDLAPQYLAEPTLLFGDFNTGKHHLDEAGATFFCADYLERLESLGWVDAWRRQHAEAREYTWYSYRGNGFRLDHAFVSPPLWLRVQRVFYSHREREQKVSDHSALVVDIE
ncbi:MAG: endonuclease/exonuclease/phosphatase family protein [Planctomycetia bacterium]|nr:endonuclease/exonuclease/phosphatase family protein [Planctomycetia bacterium]